MADKKPASKKRIVRNPETFRERAQKSSEAASQPKRARRIKQAGDQATGPARRRVSGVYQSKPLRPIRKVLSVIGKVIFPSYFRKSWQELKLVHWPNWSESRRLTFAVLVFAIIFGAAIAGVDWILDKIFKELLLK